jgi:uncharacterized protein YjbI with pentapeptide repeats
MHPQIWARLCRGESLEGLGIARVNGRLDLRNSHLPEARAVSALQTPIGDIRKLSHTTMIEGVSWRGLDLSSSQLPHIRFMDCEIEDCVFDHAQLTDLRVWGTSFRDVSFRSTYLRYAALGAVHEGRRNSFRNIDFTSADMRRSTWDSADIIGCTFKNTKLDNVEFHSTRFIDCTFEGKLREVIFYNRSFRGEAYPPNELRGCDFSRAKLRWCSFRNLELENVPFSNDDQIVIDHYPETLGRLSSFFESRTDMGSQQMAGLLEHDLRWVAPGQKVGVMSKDIVRELIGEDGLQTVLQIVGKTQ